MITAALLSSAAERGGFLPYAFEDAGEVKSMAYSRKLILDGYLSDPRVFFSPLVSRWYEERGAVAALRNPAVNTTVPWYYTNYAVNRNGAMPYKTATDGGRRPANLSRVGADGNLHVLMLLRDSYNAAWDSPPDKGRGGGRAWFSGAGYLPPLEKSYNGMVCASFADGHSTSIPHAEILRQMEVSGSLPPLFNEFYTR